MKALQFMSPDVMSLNDISTPGIAEDEVLLAARSVGICHSDIDLLAGRYIIPFEYPVIPGHEWSAEVIEVGKKVTKLKAGVRTHSSLCITGSRPAVEPWCIVWGNP
jgi:L-iditol 2-dehydrogenase